MPEVGVIVPARDAEETLGATLDGLAGQRPAEPSEVIVVDDGSSDATGELAGGHPVVSQVVRGGGEGPAAARNLGAARSRATSLAFLDADCRPSEGWLAAGMEALERAGLVQGAVAPPPEASIGPFDRTIVVNGEHGLYETANLFVAGSAFERAGGFESWLRPRRGIELGEDILFGWRVRRAGIPTAFSAKALAHHAVFARGPGGYVTERARLRFFPAIASRVPELRDSFFFGRWFLDRRSASFDLALAALAARAKGAHNVALVGALPYAAQAIRHARRAPGEATALVLAADVAADAVGFAALAAGSVRYRSPLL